MDALISNVIGNGACRITELTEHVLDKARTVKTGGRRLAAPGIAGAEKAQRVIGNFLAEIRTGGTAYAPCRLVTAFFYIGGPDKAFLTIRALFPVLRFSLRMLAVIDGAWRRRTPLPLIYPSVGATAAGRLSFSPSV